MRRAILPVIVLVAAAICLWLRVSAWRESNHSFKLHAYYQHAQDVKKGMPVCVDGVQLGAVDSVIVRPELGDHPVELTLNLNPPYDLKIPSGSTALVTRSAILGPTVVDVDTRVAHGAPLANGSTIETRESTDDQTAHALGVVVKALVDQSHTADEKGHPKSSNLTHPAK